MTHLATLRHTLIFAIFGLAALGLSACGGGGGGSTPAPAVNTSLAKSVRGFYAGNATFNGDVSSNKANVTASNNAVKAIFDEKGFVLAFRGVDNSNNSLLLVYKGSFTEVTDTTFKANVRVYDNGYYTTTATISDGKIDTANQTMTGTLSGTGAYASTTGTFNLSYTNDNSLAPPSYVIGQNNDWSDGDTTGVVYFPDASTLYVITALDGNPTFLNGCDIQVASQNMDYNQPGRIRKFANATTFSCAASTNDNGRVVSGYITNFNGNGTQDDRLMAVVYNDDYAYVGYLPCYANNTANTTADCLN